MAFRRFAPSENPIHPRLALIRNYASINAIEVVDESK